MRNWKRIGGRLVDLDDPRTLPPIRGGDGTAVADAKKGKEAKKDKDDAEDELTLDQKIDGLLAMGKSMEKLAEGLKALATVDDDERGEPYGKDRHVNTKTRNGDLEKFSIARAVAGVMGAKQFGPTFWDRFPVEKQVIFQATEEAMSGGAKAMGETTLSAGGYLVPPEYITELIEIVRAKSITTLLGVRRRPTRSNAGYISRQTGASTANWLGEGATITASDLTFDQLAFTIRKLAAYAVVSNELLRDSDPSADEIIREDLSAAIALKEDYTILYGSGTPPEPRGVKNASGVTLTSLGANGATPTFDNLIDLEANVRANNRLATGWAAAPRTTTTLRKIKDGQGNYIWNPAPYAIHTVPSLAPSTPPPATTDGSVQPARPVGMILGAPYAESTQIPVNLTQGAANNASDVFVGQWDEVLVLENGGLELAVSDQILFQNYQTAIRAIVRRDILVRHGNAFAVAIGVLP